MFITKHQRLELGLDYMKGLIAMGWNRSHVLVIAASKFGVSSMELQAAYDLSN